MDMGWILRPMSVEERKEWLLKVVRAPPPIRALVLLPTAKKYKQKVQVRGIAGAAEARGRHAVELLWQDFPPPPPSWCCYMHAWCHATL
eukprot:358521-Chlamydomonas_euryale.AAC.7